MKKLFTSSKFWIGISVLLFATLVGIIIFSASNFYQLEDYKNQAVTYENQKSVIAKLTAENQELQLEISTYKDNSIDELIRGFVDGYLTEDGSQTKNDKTNNIKPYITDKLYQAQYNPDSTAKPESYDNQVAMQSTIMSSAYELIDGTHAVGFATVHTDYTPNNPNKQYIKEGSTLINFEFTYDTDKELWLISEIRTSAYWEGENWSEAT